MNLDFRLVLDLLKQPLAVGRVNEIQLHAVYLLVRHGFCAKLVEAREESGVGDDVVLGVIRALCVN